MRLNRYVSGVLALTGSFLHNFIHSNCHSQYDGRFIVIFPVDSVSFLYDSENDHRPVVDDFAR